MTKMSIRHCNIIFLIQYNIVMFFLAFLYYNSGSYQKAVLVKVLLFIRSLRLYTFPSGKLTPTKNIDESSDFSVFLKYLPYMTLIIGRLAFLSVIRLHTIKIMLKNKKGKKSTLPNFI